MGGQRARRPGTGGKVKMDEEFERKESAMKVLLIGGTGTISMEISRRLLQEGHELYLLNRGSKTRYFLQGYAG